MTPVELAAQVYEREPCARTFREDLEAHLLNGYVFSTPELFLMGRPVNRRADRALIVDPWQAFAREECDCWLLYLAAGDLRKFWEFEPFPLDFVAWERKNVLRTYYAKNVKTICTSSRFFCSSVSAPGSCLASATPGPPSAT